MDRPHALEHRVAVLEGEVAQLREFVNAFRSSMKLGPLEPPVVHGTLGPRPTTTEPQPRPLSLSRGKGVWIFRGNATSEQMEHVREWLAIPVENHARSAEDAAVIIFVAFAPGGRTDPDKSALAQFYAAGKTVYGLVLEAGTGNTVRIPDNLISSDRQLTLTLDDDFQGMRGTGSNRDAAQRKRMVFHEAYSSANRIKDPVSLEAYASSSKVKDPVSLAGTGLRGVGAQVGGSCVVRGCAGTVLYQCDGCSEQQYCGDHTQHGAHHLNAGCPGRK